MSKVISFSISDRYLDKLRSLYPALTDNLAAKQFLTDRLDSSLGNSLDASLDDKLDDRVKTLIESWVDGLLDERLDATVGKSLTSLSERLTRLEARLDTNLDGSLDDMEPLLKLQRESSIATSPLPTGEPSPLPPSPHGEPDQPAIEDLPTVESVEPISTIETVASAIEDSEKKIVDSLDTSIASPIGIDESGSEPGTDAIGTVGMTAMAAAKYLKAKKVVVSYDSLNRWINRKKIPDSPQGKDARKHLILRDGLYFPTTD